MGQIKKILGVAALFALGLWVLSVLPFSSTIRQEITATVYRGGVAAGATTISMDGKRTDYLFRENSYVGTFSVPEVERTGREGVHAQIQWWEDLGNIQRIRYASPGMFYSDVLPSYLICNHNLTQFAFSLPDGSVVATSDQVYRIFTEHVTYTPDTGCTVIEGNIPFF